MRSLGIIWLANLTLVFVSAFLVLAIAEITLRLVNFSFPAWEVRDPDLGFVTMPHAEGWWTSEGNAYVKFNKFGFRDLERKKAKLNNSFRIAVVGDSFTQAREVNLEDTFVYKLEVALRECHRKLKQQVEVLNFGMGGYNTAAELQLLETRVFDFKPDLVLLAFYVGNDIHYNHPKMGYFRDISGIGQPLLRFEQGQVKVDFSFRNDAVFQQKLRSRFHRLALTLINKFKIFQALYFLKTEFQDYFVKKPTIKRQETQAGGNLNSDFSNLISPPREKLWQEAWKLTEAALLHIRDRVQEQGAAFWMAVIAHPRQIHTSEPVNEINYPQERIARLASTEEIPLVDFLIPFRQEYQMTKNALHGFKPTNLGRGHWNHRGHELAAQVLGKRLCSNPLNE